MGRLWVSPNPVWTGLWNPVESDVRSPKVPFARRRMQIQGEASKEPLPFTCLSRVGAVLGNLDRADRRPGPMQKAH